jgi:hypothetical protein
VPTAPTFINAHAVSKTLIQANLAVVKGATGYMFQIMPVDAAPHNIGNRTGYSAGDVQPGKTYTVRAAAVNAAGTGPYVSKKVTTPR